MVFGATSGIPTQAREDRRHVPSAALGSPVAGHRIGRRQSAAVWWSAIEAARSGCIGYEGARGHSVTNRRTDRRWLHYGSLTLFSAIEEWVVLRATRGTGLIDNLIQAFAGIRASVGEPQIVIGCDCVLRKVEILQSRLIEQVQEIFRAGHVVGFNSYGDQYQGVHVNQTFTGVAIGDDFR
jgi:hypothetical protein